MKRLSIDEAVARLRENGIVALPTETVYGLAARADRAEAVEKIFKAKERPALNPLICHVSSVDMLERYALIEEADRPLFQFWPGPLTVLLRKLPGIPDIVTAGSPLCAFRIPGHPIFLRIIERVGAPLAAPSANRSGRTSPVTAGMVESSLEGRIDGVVDGGQCRFGLESTVVRRVTEDQPHAKAAAIKSPSRNRGSATQRSEVEILRPGAVTKEMLEAGGFIVRYRPDGPSLSRESAKGLLSPGLLPAHYAPAIPLVLIETTAEEGLDRLRRMLALPAPEEALEMMAPRDGFSRSNLRELLAHPDCLMLLLFREQQAESDSIVAEIKEKGLSILEPAPGNLEEFGRQLYAAFDTSSRTESEEAESGVIDESHLAILTFAVPDRDIGHAINDRLRRAATARIRIKDL